MESTTDLDSKKEGGMTKITMNELALLKWILILLFSALVSATSVRRYDLHFKVSLTPLKNQHSFILQHHTAVGKFNSFLESMLNPFQ